MNSVGYPGNAEKTNGFMKVYGGRFDQWPIKWWLGSPKDRYLQCRSLITKRILPSTEISNGSW